MENQIHPRRFEFARDSFAFANELIWEYRPDAATGRMEFLPRTPKPDYAHRCFVLARAARQFLYHATFDARLAPVDEAAYRHKIREVMARNPRQACAPGTEVVFPGYENLRAFSAAQGPLLKAGCGGAWQSYVLRSHWRMIFPISRTHQESTAKSLAAALEKGVAPIVHLVKFPSLTINHGMILFDAKETKGGWEFSAYDPNDPGKPARLAYERDAKTFILPANHYWAGGEVNIIEIYRSWWM